MTDYTTLHNVMQHYTTLYKAIRYYTMLLRIQVDRLMRIVVALVLTVAR